ncbi:PREDICTED: uncharacterized protein LOC105448599 [Wasmannia auropunctata]|uniref:uncharacterized protein LOC105448599 n=1 Tax=Wasmannia auropunctata TaxID=64793 RepID=UPI0005EF6822|nr:PREDICTED: uncharacterized protein LOC105448599 [Wasmannia auropunctata]XP_011685568.1 PREDICTED: uncharacterized protein LOC105448599 [Wasmannia auropunctata]XP_011685569.1 PREDICTED: uncharacterized protein LOC105448599 [Wasmannia auropunctata]
MAYILNKATVLCRPVFRKNIISGPLNKITLVKSNQQMTNKTNAWAEQKYKLMDNISDGYRLVYRELSAISTTITVAYHAGWLGVAVSTISLGYLIYMRPPVQDTVRGSDEKLLMPLSAVGRIIALLGSFAVAAILIVGSKTIPYRIYYNAAEKVYKAVFVNRILGKKQIETFGEGTVVPVFSRKYIGDILFKINGRIVILDKECFPVQSIRDQMICKIK